MATDEDIKKALEDSTAASKNLAETITDLKSNLISINANIASLSLNDSIVELKKGMNDQPAITTLNDSIVELQKSMKDQPQAITTLNSSMLELQKSMNKDKDKDTDVTKSGQKKTGVLGGFIKGFSSKGGKGGMSGGMKGMGKAAGWLGAVLLIVKPLISALKFMSATIFSSFDTFSKMSGKFAAIGGNMNILNKTMDESVAAYGANLTGFTNTMETQIAALTAGTSANSRGMQQLGQQLKATGQSQERVFGILAKFNIGASISTEAQGNLASNIVGLSENFGVKSEVLADALKNTGDELKTLGAIFGTSIDIQRQVVNLAAVAGPAGAGMASKFLSVITKGSNILSRSFLGVQEAANNMARGGPAIDVAVKAGLRAEKMFGGISKSSGSLLFQFDVLNKMVPGAREALLVLKEMRKRADDVNMTLEEYTAKAKKEQKASDMFAKSMAALKERILDPLKVIGFKLLEAVERYLQKNKHFLGGIGKVVGKIMKMDKVFDTVVQAVFSLGKAFVVLGQWVAGFVGRFSFLGGGRKRGEKSMSAHLEDMAKSFGEAKDEWNRLSMIEENTAAIKKSAEDKNNEDKRYIVDRMNDTLITLLPVLDSIKENTRDTADKDAVIVVPDTGSRGVPGV